MYHQTPKLKPFYNVGAEPQNATDDLGGSGERVRCTARCVRRVENESVIVCQCSTGRVNARVLRGPLGSLGAPGDVVARCCLVALAEDSRGASSFEEENGTTMRRRRVAQHPNNRDSE